jgi:hypothetical protein
VPEEKGGIASAVNGCTLLFGGTLGVAVIGSVAASLYTSRLTALLPPGLPARAVAAARGSVGGAAAAASHLSQAGLPIQARALEHAAVLAFLHSLTAGCLVAAAIAAAGCLLVAFLLPARPGAVHPATGPAASPPPHAADGPDRQVPAGTPTPTSAVLADSRQDQPPLTDHDQTAAR